MSDSPTPAEVILDAARTSLRAGRLPRREVIARQLDALAQSGYRLEPHLDDGGAALMLSAAKRAFRTGRLAPAAVVARQLAAIRDAGHAFVSRDEAARPACASFQWGPESFDACAGCGQSFWQHAEGRGHAKAAHRRD